MPVEKLLLKDLVREKEENPWQTICPSPIPFQETWHVPQEMKLLDIERVKKQLISASLKAVEIGFDLI